MDSVAIDGGGESSDDSEARCGACGEAGLFRTERGGVQYPQCGHTEHLVCARSHGLVCTICSVNDFPDPRSIISPPSTAACRWFQEAVARACDPVVVQKQRRTGWIFAVERARCDSIANACTNKAVQLIKDRLAREVGSDPASVRPRGCDAISDFIAVALRNHKPSSARSLTAEAAAMAFTNTGTSTARGTLRESAVVSATNVCATEGSTLNTSNALLMLLSVLGQMDETEAEPGVVAEISASSGFSITDFAAIAACDAHTLFADRADGGMGLTLAVCVQHGLVTSANDLRLFDPANLLPYLKNNIAPLAALDNGQGNDIIFYEILEADVMLLAGARLEVEELKLLCTPAVVNERMKNTHVPWDLFSYLGHAGLLEWGVDINMMRDNRAPFEVEKTLRRNGWTDSDVLAFTSTGRGTAHRRKLRNGGGGGGGSKHRLSHRQTGHPRIPPSHARPPVRAPTHDDDNNDDDDDERAFGVSRPEMDVPLM